MKEFVLIFRTATSPDFKPSEEQSRQMMTSWMSWMNGIAAQDKLASNGSRLGFTDAKVVKPGNVVTNGPFTEIKEFINGYIIVKTKSVDEAVEIAKECPMVKGGGGSVEIRPAVTPEDNS
ncbi:MAG: YciI family protein [Bacteroidota bacterium]|nr:YciI family protein [Bacteroidota bacterium]